MSEKNLAVKINCESFSYGTEENNLPNVLENFEMQINYGEITLISGLSGSGKSTLLSLVNGIIPRIVSGTFKGEVLIDGKSSSGMSMSEISKKVGTVLQNAEEQIIHQIVEDEIAFGCENFGFLPEEISNQIEKSCKIMQLDKSWKTRTLSGGQKQRLVTASTLAMKTPILIFDEPLANLDFEGANLLLKLLKNLAAEGKAVVLVEHRLDVVLPFVDKIWQLKDKKVFFVNDKNEYLKSQIDIIEDKKENFVASKEVALEIQNLKKSFGKREILKGINCKIFKGERILLSGENGSGKSTLLSIIGRLQKADSGKIIQNLDKKCKNRANKKWFKTCGMIFQNPNYQLFMPTVKDEILFGSDDESYAMQIAEKLELTSLLDRHPQSLSEGQKRRLTVAAILAQKPKLLLLDEPTVGQDYHTLQKMMSLINEIHREQKNTMITITHDIRCKKALCDRELHLVDGEVVE